MMRSRIVIALAIAFQIGVVAAMAISREWILATGTPYTFQTAPIDPRDIFRGDYVRLSYLFSSVPVSMLDEEIMEKGLRKGQKVYLALSRDINGVSQGEALYATPPQDRPYIMGRASYFWPYRGFLEQPPEKRKQASRWPVSVRYGIEQYYVEQGSGRAIERTRGSRNEFQLPMLVNVGVSDAGEAVIRSYEWATLATKTEIVQSPQRDAPDEEASAIIRLTVKNRSERTVTLPLKEGNCSFALVPVPRSGNQPHRFAAERSDCRGARVQSITLAPEQSHSVTFDLNRPHWYVMYNDKPTPMGKLPWGYRYRIRYQGETVAGVKGDILSRAFHGRGNVD